MRYAVALLLQNPSFIEAVEPPPYPFADLRKPGVSLLSELLDFCRARPAVNTAALLQHFQDRDESAALNKLAMQPLHGDAATLQKEFLDSLRTLGQQTVQQRRDELIAKDRVGRLSEEERSEMRSLLAQRR